MKKDGLWGHLSAPSPPASDAKAHREHVVTVEKAAGLVYLSVSPQLQGEKDSAKSMLDALELRFGSSVLLLGTMLSPA